MHFSHKMDIRGDGDTKLPIHTLFTDGQEANDVGLLGLSKNLNSRKKLHKIKF